MRPGACGSDHPRTHKAEPIAATPNLENAADPYFRVDRRRGRDGPLERWVRMLKHLRSRRLNAQRVRDGELIQESPDSLEQRGGEGVLILGGKRGNETDVHKPNNSAIRIPLDAVRFQQCIRVRAYAVVL